MHKRWWSSALLIALACAVVPAHAQDTPDDPQCVPQDDSNKQTDPQDPDCDTQQRAIPYDPQTALMTVVEPKIEADTTSASPLGDDYDPVTGAVTFSTTDISIPGNFPIPVELRRWVPRDDYDTGGPTGWAWNIPFIKGNYLDVKDGHGDVGWDWGLNTWHDGYNCSGSAVAVIDNQGELIGPNAYWSGKLLHIPGVTSETFLTKSDGTQLTKSNFRIASCITNPDGQQGIVVAGPDGLTYTFNQIKSYYNKKPALKDPIVRTRLLMVTKIEDRFGNHVDYSYANGELTSISASDGRAITIDYALVGTSKRRPTTATAHGRTWTYGYAGTSQFDPLATVTLPDGTSQWSYSNVGVTAFQVNGVGNYSQQFQYGGGLPTIVPGCSTAGTQHVATVKSPHGLTSTYTFKDLVLYRADVEPDLYADIHSPDYVVSRALHCTLSRALIAKSIAGPGVPTASWTYVYSPNMGTYTAASGLNGLLTGPFVLSVPGVGGYPTPITSANAVDYRSTTVTGPDRKVVFYIDRKFQSITENRVVAQDTLNAAGNALLQRTQSVFWSEPNAVGTHWYMCPCDGAYPPVNEIQLSHRIHQTEAIDKRYLLGGTDTYTTAHGNFDSYGFALTTQESNSVNGGWTRTTTRTYLHDTTNGLIGLPLTEAINGMTAVQNHYNSLGQLDWTKSFGKLKATLAYWADGTLKTVKDGNNNLSTLSNWKRGTPQLVQFADTTSRSGMVNDNGWLTSTTDENGYTTSYTYDAMGQLASIVRPTGDSTAWTTTTRSFAPVSTTEYGLAAGHFRETISTGNARKLVYYDALLRPRVIREYDAANEAGTKRFQRFAYDLEGRTTFAAYPGTSDALSTGTWTEYDALGRVTAVAQDTELSPSLQIASTDYLNGSRVRTINPRGEQTTTTYLAYGQPTEWPVLIAHPEGAYTHITRDAWGKPLTIRRSDSASPTGGIGISRTYLYNANAELCRSVEPETGATLFGYDAAGNLKWSAAGLAGTPACEAHGTSSAVAARRVDRTYDARNRLATLAFPDGNGNQVWTYTDDGLPDTVVTSNAGASVSNSYTYNKRRLLTAESMVPDGAQTTWAMGYGYNALGQVVTEVHPGGLTATYTVNALGQTTQVTASTLGVSTPIAGAATYYPNGALKGFTYGNGIVRAMTQNARQLPARSTDGTVLDLGVTFDENGNVTGIDDYAGAGRQNRTMAYDGLDRLVSATSPMFGTATYTYDVLDNLTRAQVTGGTQARDHGYCFDDANRLTQVKAGTCSGGLVMSLTYDVQGNLSNRNGVGFTFDYGNRLRSTAGIAYRYDAQGRRVRQDNAGGQLKYSFYTQDGRLVWQRDEQASQRIHNLYLAGSLVAEYRRAIGSTAVTVEYQHTDALGSPIARTNAAGTVIQTSEYEPYGKLLNRANNDRAGYTGHVMDAASGMTYMEQRYYDPMIPRFLSVDPVTAYSDPIGAFHRYRYASNNPYRFTDPDGRQGKIAWLVKLGTNQMRKVARITQEQAVRARRGGENVVADRRQAASQIEAAANGAEGQLKHAGHELKDGSKGLPHYQTEGTQGHTFWGKLSVATVAVADALDQVAEAADRIDPVAVMTNIPEAGQPGVVHECANGCSNLPQDSDSTQEERQSELPPSPNED